MKREILLRDFVTEVFFLKPRVAGGSEATRAEYLSQVHQLEFFACERGICPLRLADLDEQLLEGAMAWQIARGREAATANKLRRSIVACWRHAVQKGYLPRPDLPGTNLAQVERYAELKREPECWSLDEFCRLLSAAAEQPGMVGDVPAGAWWVALVYFVFNTGARISAVMQTPTAGLDLDRAEVLVPAESQKQKADQRFDLQQETVAALRLIRPERLAHVFDDWPYDRGQRPWRTLNRHLRQILVRAGLPNTNKDLWHKIRRTFATFVAAKGGKSAASTLLGHSCLSVTERYLDKRYLQLPSVAEILPHPKPQIQLRLWRGDAG